MGGVQRHGSYTIFNRVAKTRGEISPIGNDARGEEELVEGVLWRSLNVKRHNKSSEGSLTRFQRRYLSKGEIRSV